MNDLREFIKTKAQEQLAIDPDHTKYPKAHTLEGRIGAFKVLQSQHPEVHGGARDLWLEETRCKNQKHHHASEVPAVVSSKGQVHMDGARRAMEQEHRKAYPIKPEAVSVTLVEGTYQVAVKALPQELQEAIKSAPSVPFISPRMKAPKPPKPEPAPKAPVPKGKVQFLIPSLSFDALKKVLESKDVTYEKKARGIGFQFLVTCVPPIAKELLALATKGASDESPLWKKLDAMGKMKHARACGIAVERINEALKGAK